MLGYLKGQGEQTFELMQIWIGDYFNAEMSAIEQMSDQIRSYIENAQPVDHEIRLEVDVCRLFALLFLSKVRVKK